jgi:apolipoprotein N-acyltransferase
VEQAPAVALPWVERLAARYGAWLALAAGAASSLAFAPAGLYPLSILGPALLFLLWEGRRPAAAALIGFAYAFGLFLAGTYWIYIAVHEVGKAPAWLAVFLLLGLVSIMAAYFALLGALAARLVPRPTALRWLAFLPGGWLLVEWLRGWLFSGFPWLAIGYAHIDSPLAGLAPVAGIHAVTLAAALTAGAVVALVHGSTRERVAAAVAVAVTWAAAAALGGRAWTEPSGPPIDVAIVQAAVPQDDKWADANRDAILDRFRDMTRPVLGRRLIVWPEAAIPVLAHEAGPYLAAMWTEAQRAGSDLVLGLLRYDFDNSHYYNGVLALAGEEAGWYYKRRLVPFGEFFPVPDFIRSWMRLMSLAYADMTPGAADQPALAAGGVKVGVTVCYEDAYGAEQLAVLREAELLINVTNNAWFGDSTAPHQQMQMARFRALEAGRYLVRATSNGITGIIGPDGQVVARAPQFVPDVLLGEARPFTGLTPYARTGNWPVLLLASLMVLAAVGATAAGDRRRRSLNAASR